MGHLPVAILASCALVVAACGTGAPFASDPGPNATGLPTPDLPGRAVRIDDVTLSDDQRVVTLQFTGAPEYEPTNPCGMAYSAEAEIVRGELEVAVYERRSPAALPLVRPMACPAVGAIRTLSVELAEPYAGSLVRDEAGYVFFVAPPAGLAELRDLAPEWQLADQYDLQESPTGRWARIFARAGTPPGQSGPGRLDFYQSFGGPVHVSGTDEEADVDINGSKGELWTWAATGEIVLSWRLSGDGLAIVANEGDFSIDELIALAESAVLPDR